VIKFKIDKVFFSIISIAIILYGVFIVYAGQITIPSKLFRSSHVLDGTQAYLTAGSIILFGISILIAVYAKTQKVRKISGVIFFSSILLFLVTF